jgi:anaerobic magnesium-protoporphyrin IX monomethyl ester cyclase
LIYKNGQNGYIKTARRPEIDDIDSIPFPDYDGFNYSQYMKSINYTAAYIIASRSCPFSCTFCFHPSGKKYRQRSLDNLFIEIDYLAKTYAAKSLVISDELFAVKRERVFEFCQRIKPYKITWSLQLRVSDVDIEMLRVMRDAGCICISYGLESADNSVLKSMKKHITVEQIEHSLKITYDANIDIQGGFIFGDIAETKDTAANTLRWYYNHPHYGLELNMIHIFPGTQLYNYACAHGIIKNKVNYIKEGCPLTNVSRLTDQAYKDLSSLLYETNMCSKYLPEIFSVTDIELNGGCKVEMTCNKCGAQTSFTANVLHVKRMLCPQCMQRHYVDPFQKISHSEETMRNYFENDEICIKLLDNYTIFKDNNFTIVDISKSRQGYTVRGKKIFSPEMINEKNIKTIIIAVITRKDEILGQLSTFYPAVTKIYLPDITKIDGRLALILRELKICR